MTQLEPTSTELAPANKRQVRRYTEEDTQRGLLALALCNGNHRHAETHLAEQGHHIPGQTLRNWKNQQHADRYNKLRADLVPQIHARIATQAEDNARQALEAQALAVELTKTQLETGTSKTPPSTVARDLATVAGILIDKANLQRGRPTEIRETRDVAGILRSLEHAIPGIQPSIEGTAEDHTDENPPMPGQREDQHNTTTPAVLGSD